MARRKTRTRRKSRRGGRRTKRKTRRRTRRRRSRRRTKRRGGGGGGSEGEKVPEVQGEEVPVQTFAVAGAPQQGGKRKSKAKKGGKRKINAYFKQMLAAKKKGLSEFTYTKKGGKAQRYVGRKHARLGMIYKKA